MMAKMKDAIASNIEESTKKINILKEKLSYRWADLESTEEAYQLHSICVHDGNADGGHYFVFIKDHRQNKWRKYNDMKVTEVDESDVFQ